MSYTTTSQIDGPVDVVFQQTLLRNAKPRCPYFTGATPGDIRSHQGTFTVTWRRYENLTPTTSALTALTGSVTYPTRTASQPSITDMDATVAKYGDFFVLNEEVDLKNFSNQGDKLAEVLGIQAGRSLNRLQRNVLEDNLTLVYADGASADSGVSSVITRNLIESVVNTLDRNSAMPFTAMSTGSQNIGSSPILPAFWGLCHSDVAVDITKLAGFKSVETYAGHTQVATGEIGMVMVAGVGVRFVSTPEASQDTDSGSGGGTAVRSTSGAVADLYTTCIFGKETHGSLSLDTSLIKETYEAGDMIPGIQMISKTKGSAGTADPLNEVASVGWKAWHAGRILNTTWGRGIRTAASKLS